MTNPHTTAPATMPWAMNHLVAMLVEHQLPTPGEIAFRADSDHVAIILTEATADAWLDVLTNVTHTTRPPLSPDKLHGEFHDATGRLGEVHVRLTWYAPDEPLIGVPTRPELSLVVDSHAADWHTACSGDPRIDDAGHLTVCVATPGCYDVAGVVPGACPHGLDLCAGCVGACSECVDDRRQDPVD